MGFWICWYFLSLWVPNYTFQYRIHYHDATTSPPSPLTLKGVFYGVPVGLAFKAAFLMGFGRDRV